MAISNVISLIILVMIVSMGIMNGWNRRLTITETERIINFCVEYFNKHDLDGVQSEVQ